MTSRDLPISSRSRFQNPIFDLNQIRAPRAPAIVIAGLEFLQSKRSGRWRMPNEVCALSLPIVT
jgi:hypothetical protein